MLTVSKYFLYFITYSFLGWLMEVCYIYIREKKFVNRGFLIGPICPIYGYGVLAIILLIGKDTSDVLSVFLKAILICSLLEYFTSYFMEKIFKARWWDYSNRKFNINGRICLETMLPFGILGCTVVYLLHPLVVRFINIFSSTLTIVIAVIIFIIYLVDSIISFRVMNKIKKEIKKQAVDNTELIRKRVIEWLESNSKLYRHIKNAYPKFEINENIIRKIRNGKHI